MYFVANNLHGWVMSQYSPNKYFIFSICLGLRENITNMNDSETGFFVAFDSRYPLNLRKKNWDIPFLPPKEKHCS